MPAAAYLINPNFRLTSQNLSVVWHLVDVYALQTESALNATTSHIFKYKGIVQIMVRINGNTVDMIYHSASDFQARGIQKWLRELFRDIIMKKAEEILPQRVKFWENEKKMYGTGVSVKPLRKTVLACCSYNNHITLQPFLVLFRQDWCDEIILHEMAHYVHKHHRHEFWKFLSELLGRDAKAAKAQKDIELSPYYGYCLYLTRK